MISVERCAAVVAVGSELLRTDRLDTNSLRIAALLEELGVEMVFKCVVGDRLEAIVEALSDASRRAPLVVVTGGLGPTRDDLTRDALALWTGVELREDEGVLSWIREMYARRGRRMPESNRRQALVPEGAKVLDNPRGTAPALLVEKEKLTVFALPGVPTEVEGLLESELRPWLRSRVEPVRRRRAELAVACLPESLVEERIGPLYERWGADSIAVLARPGEVRLRLETGPDGALEEMVEHAEGLLGAAVFARSTAGGASSLEEAVGSLLASAHQTVSVAESCTGGMLGERLTAVAGSSAYFLGGGLTYSDELKIRLLGVDAESIRRHGAVSSEVAGAMAAGARREFGSDWSLAITGIAGPGGGSEEKPVGTVWFGLAAPDGGVATARVVFPGDRERIRRQASQYALDMLRRAVAALPALRDHPWLGSSNRPADGAVAPAEPPPEGEGEP